MSESSGLTFVECDTCRPKIGFIQLCRGCYHNRSAIHNARKANTASATVDPFSPTFMKCDTCAASGSPALCGGCVHNKATIELICAQLAGTAPTEFQLWNSMSDGQRYEHWKRLYALFQFIETNKIPRAFEEARRLLLRCHDRAYNPFEPENQSDEYNRLHTFLFPSDG